MAGSGVKIALKSGLAKSMPLITPLVARGPRQTRILTYHSVGTRDHEMNVTPAAFAEQMRWLHEHATVVSLEDAAAGAPGIAVTLDDGYRDNLTEAAPILERYSIPATVFVVPGRVGGFLDHDRQTEDARLMTWEEIFELRERGVAIGGHTLNHARLSSLTEAEQIAEISACTELLREKLGESPKAFAYPFGSALDYDVHSVEAVQRSGYAIAVSNRYGPVNAQQSRWEIRRIWIDHRDTLDSFVRKVTGDLDGLSIFDSYLGIRSRRLMNRLLGVS